MAKLKILFQPRDNRASRNTLFVDTVLEKAYCFTELIEVLRAFARLCLNVTYVCLK